MKDYQGTPQHSDYILQRSHGWRRPKQNLHLWKLAECVSSKSIRMDTPVWIIMGFSLTFYLLILINIPHKDQSLQHS